MTNRSLILQWIEVLTVTKIINIILQKKTYPKKSMHFHFKANMWQKFRNQLKCTSLLQKHLCGPEIKCKQCGKLRRWIKCVLSLPTQLSH